MKLKRHVVREGVLDPDRGERQLKSLICGKNKRVKGKEGPEKKNHTHHAKKYQISASDGRGDFLWVRLKKNARPLRGGKHQRERGGWSGENRRLWCPVARELRGLWSWREGNCV